MAQSGRGNRPVASLVIPRPVLSFHTCLPDVSDAWWSRAATQRRPLRYLSVLFWVARVAHYRQPSSSLSLLDNGENILAII